MDESHESGAVGLEMQPDAPVADHLSRAKALRRETISARLVELAPLADVAAAKGDAWERSKAVLREAVMLLRDDAEQRGREFREAEDRAEAARVEIKALTAELAGL